MFNELSLGHIEDTRYAITNNENEYNDDVYVISRQRNTIIVQEYHHEA